MTSPPENSSARRTAPRRLLIAAALALGASAWAGACSTAETIAFSDGNEGDCVAGGCAQGASSSSSTASSSSSSSSGSACTIDMNCAVKWNADIFTKIISSTTHNCAGSGVGVTMSCHGDGKGMLTLSGTDAHASYLALKDWKIMNDPEKGKSYIVPCDKAGSGMLCNLNVLDADGGADPNFGGCGSAMPLFGANLTMAEYNQIADWIACGAPEN